MDKASLGVTLLIAGLLFILFSYGEQTPPSFQCRDCSDAELTEWESKCVDVSSVRGYCYEYEKGWSAIPLTVGVLLCTGGIACFFDAGKSSTSSTQGTNSYVQPLTYTHPQNIQNKPKRTRRKKNSVKNKMSLIKELRELQDAGGLSDAEFKQLKKEILGK